ncbi:MAG: hypothetical protein ABH846_02095 [Patescibacteria group bacterium]
MKRGVLIFFAVLLLQPLSLFQPREASAASFRDLLTCPLYSTVYYIAQDGSRWIIPNESTYFTWFDDFSNVKEVDCQVFADIPLGQLVAYQHGTRLVKQQSSPEVYAVEPGGQLKHITNEVQALSLYGNGWNERIDDVNDAFWWSYDDFSDFIKGDYPLGTFLRDASTGWHYMMYSDGARIIGEERVTDIQKRYAIEVNIDAVGIGTPVISTFWNDMTDLAYRPTAEELAMIEDDLTDGQTDDQTDDAQQPDVSEVLEGFVTPSLLDPGDITISQEQIILQWNKISEATSYRLQEDDNVNFTSPTLVYSGNDRVFRTTISVDKIKTYYYRVQAIKEGNFRKETDFSNIVDIQIQPYYIIADVPSEFQPPTRTLSTDKDDFSAPFAAAQILSYHSEKNTNENADNLTAGLEIETLAEYIGWFMNTNHAGSEDRLNFGFDGTLNGDMKDGLADFTQWDGTTGTTSFDVPPKSINKDSYLWRFAYHDSTDTGPGSFWDKIKQNILDDKPVLAVFRYWNPNETDINVRLDDIDFYDWGDSITDSKDADIIAGDPPNEDWDFQEGLFGIGHAVTIVGVIPNFDIDADGDNETDQSVDWVIVHDTWSNTPRQFAIPFDHWSAGVLISP